jgi:hypothetical protein
MILVPAEIDAGIPAEGKKESCLKHYGYSRRSYGRKEKKAVGTWSA